MDDRLYSRGPYIPPIDTRRLPDERIISAEEQQKAFRSAQRHTRRVKWLKWGLPIIAIGIVAGFAVWVSRQAPVLEPVEVTDSDTALQQDELIMQNPNLSGYTSGRAYHVVAERAVQKVDTPDVINLENLSARITDDNEDWVTVDAKTGRFNQTEETLDLTGAVDVHSSLGYGLTTEAVDIEMKQGYMKTRTPVHIRSKDVDLQAQTLEAINNGEQFRFTGGVKLRIDRSMMNAPAQETSAGQTPAETPSETPAETQEANQIQQEQQP